MFTFAGANFFKGFVMTNNFKPTEYSLVSLASGIEFADNGWSLDCADETKQSLIKAKYSKKQLSVGDESLGIYKFADWLPIKTLLKNPSSPVTYKSEGLAKKLGLKNLYITFNGWWPEKGATMRTCSFKEMEAFSVCARLGADLRKKVMVVASAGNTARAFAQVCSDNNINLLLCVPEDNLSALWFEKPLNSCVKLVTTASGSDYFDAIELSNMFCALDGFFAEGGAKNIARRDGMGTTMLSATTTIGRIPDFYFQAVGSGTGAIAAWEANLRFIEDGRFGTHKAHLYLSQNKPFVPMYDAWKHDSRQLLPYDAEKARADASKISAVVLSNRKPPYSINGGLYDALKDTEGEFFAIDNKEVADTCAMFEQCEGIDIYSASAVATASLVKAVDSKQVDRDSVIMLNITGGGERRFKSQKELFYLQPDRIFDLGFDMQSVAAEAERLKW